mmetsp:Transcript_32629/g.107898  ORF Transcript_32629/g.107898 Transcript_32629/m.107898 type:complete len:322 (-) Transcript_32629:588-1553(-)
MVLRHNGGPRVAARPNEPLQASSKRGATQEREMDGPGAAGRAHSGAAGEVRRWPPEGRRVLWPPRLGGRGGESRLLRAEGAPREEGVRRRRAASVPRVVVVDRHAQHGRLRNLQIGAHDPGRRRRGRRGRWRRDAARHGAAQLGGAGSGPERAPPRPPVQGGRLERRGGLARRRATDLEHGARDHRARAEGAGVVVGGGAVRVALHRHRLDEQLRRHLGGGCATEEGEGGGDVDLVEHARGAEEQLDLPGGERDRGAGGEGQLRARALAKRADAPRRLVAARPDEEGAAGQAALVGSVRDAAARRLDARPLRRRVLHAVAL